MFRIKKKRFPEKIEIFNFIKKAYQEKKIHKEKNFWTIYYVSLLQSRQPVPHENHQALREVSRKRIVYIANTSLYPHIIVL